MCMVCGVSVPLWVCCAVPAHTTSERLVGRRVGVGALGALLPARHQELLHAGTAVATPGGLTCFVNPLIDSYYFHVCHPTRTYC